jgi:acetyl esterase
MPLDPDVRAYLDAVEEALRSGAITPIQELPPPEARAAFEAPAAQLFGSTDPVGSVVDRVLPGPGGPIRIRIYEPAGAEAPLPVLAYFHGGGWVVGSLETHDGVARALASRTPCVVVAVDYRLAPEHRFPAAVEDAWAATAWVAEHASIGADAGRIAVGGDSAGGNLAAVVAVRARDHGLPLALQLLVYPVTDYSFQRPSYDEYADGYGLTAAAMRWYWEQYLGPGGHGLGLDPEASPLRATDLAGVAPARVLTVEFDPLRDEGEEYAAHLSAAGVVVTQTRHEGLIHGCYRMPGTIPRAQRLLDESAAALREAFGSAPDS